MRSLATEFPVIQQTNADFFAHLIQWLRGTRYSSVLDSLTPDIQTDNFFARSMSGETLHIREFADEIGLSAVGFRHDYPDDEGRNWRTEAVLLRRPNEPQDLVRIRTQCQARVPEADIVNPKKPYLIKAWLKDNWGGTDGLLRVQGEPLWLDATEDHLKLAKEIIFGRAMNDLPVVYITSRGISRWDLPAEEIERLAYRLGGVAHVVVEPDRVFSFDLKFLAEEQNAYGGAIGIYAPVLGEIGRYFLGQDLPTVAALSDRLEKSALALRSRLPVRGWDWTELQEASLRSRRNAGGKDMEFKELEALYLEEIETLKEQIEDQKQTIEDQNRHLAENEKARSHLQEDPFVALRLKAGTNLYPGEIADRLRYAASLALAHAAPAGMDERTKAILKIFVEEMSKSTEYEAFIDQLKACTSANDRLSSALIPFLESHGYFQKSDKNHIRMEPQPELLGVGSITISKTPSDHRAAANMRKQILQTLGLRPIDF